MTHRDRQVGECAGPERVVIERARELECRAARVVGLDEPLAEASRTGEPDLDVRLQRGARLGFQKSLLEQRDRASIVSSSAKTMSASARSGPLGIGKRGRDRSRARPFARGLVRTSRGQRSTTALVRLGFRVKRSACSESSAASAEAPRSMAMIAASSRVTAISASAPRWTARGGAPERQGRRRDLQCERERSGACPRGRCRALTTATDA